MLTVTQDSARYSTARGRPMPSTTPRSAQVRLRAPAGTVDLLSMLHQEVHLPVHQLSPHDSFTSTLRHPLDQRIKAFMHGWRVVRTLLCIKKHGPWSIAGTTQGRRYSIQSNDFSHPIFVPRGHLVKS